MTLISNILHNDYIIIASDKRRTITSAENKLESVDDENKLLLGENYALGIQGTLKTKKEKYLEKLRAFVKENKIANPPEFIQKILKLFPDIEKDELVTELNFTVSGFYKDALFSYYINVVNSTVIDNIENDKYAIRANNENDRLHDNSVLLRTLLIHIKRYLNDKGLYEGFKTPSLLHFDNKVLLNSLDFAYSKFHDNDLRYFTIGGQMEYCVFSNKAIIDTNL
ncbi:MAG: hypothetical protein EOO43_11820 [Flavobacterium sp.]|nr:MAG: hypothetical protein EOO43_11820 [Flavobacterium sp.]